MIFPPPPSPAPGDRRPPIRAGRGAMATSGPFGIVIGAPGKRQRFPARFQAFLSGNGLVFGRGLINAQYEPTINGKPASGTGESQPPVLELDKAKKTKEGESWACVRVTPNAEGELDEKSKIEIVHDDRPMVYRGPYGQQAIAIVIWEEDRPRQVEQITMFNFVYECVRDPQSGALRHFFR